MTGSAKRRTAAITPVVNAVRVVVVLGAIVLLNAIGQLQGGNRGFLLAAIGGLVLVAILVVFVTYLQWSRLQYWFDDDGDLRVQSGVLQHRERRLQLSRLQSVEVMQPLLARVFGMAEVRVEVAGSGDSRITLSYLTLPDAQALRAETLARAAGVRHDAGEAPESVLVQVPTSVLLWSSVLTSGVWATAFAVVAFVIVLSVLAGPAGAIGPLFLLLIPLGVGFARFSSYFNFTVAESPDGLRTRCGLLGVQAHTIPPGRVASLEFVEPLLWRPFGWVAVRLTVAGVRADSDEGTSAANTLLPVSTWPVATDLVHRFFAGLDIHGFPMTPSPPQARWRAPLQRRNLGLGSDGVMMGTRRGWLTRRTTFTPHARVQSVRLTRGPWEKALGLASVHADIVPGPIKVTGLYRSQQDARNFALAEVERARIAGMTDSSVRWGLAPGNESGDGPTPDESEG